MKAINELGNTHHFLEVVDSAGADPVSGNLLWLCSCVCGKEVIRSGADLRRGHFKSCGCRQGFGGGPERTGLSKVLKQHYNSYKSSKNGKILGFYLSESQFEELCRQNCTYCDRSPQYRHVKYRSSRNGPLYTGDNLSGIDRIDSKIGYTLENSAPCCGVCNNMKRDLSQVEFIEHVKSILEYQKRFPI